MCFIMLNVFVYLHVRTGFKVWDRSHRKTLTDCYTLLVEEMEADGTLLNCLTQYEVLNKEEHEEIRAITVRHKKNEKLLDLIMTTTSAQYEEFLKALKESKQEHIHDILCRRASEGNVTSLTCCLYKLHVTVQRR